LENLIHTKFHEIILTAARVDAGEQSCSDPKRTSHTYESSRIDKPSYKLAGYVEFSGSRV
jgi:hypothetical protein